MARSPSARPAPSRRTATTLCGLLALLAAVAAASSRDPRDPLPPTPLPTPPQQPPHEWHEFYFTRAAYSSGGGGWGRRGRSWATDYPKSDRQFVTVLKRLTNLDVFDYENAVLLTDPAIRRFPFLYALEVGYMSLSEQEVTGLRDYLKAGGFLVIDDFWGTREWAEQPDYPLEYSTFAFQMGVNMIVYAMSH